MKIPKSSFKAMSIVGSSSTVTIVAGVIRTKAVALTLGAAGVGVLGLLQQTVAVASTIFGLGLRQAGTKEIAKAQGAVEGRDLWVVRRALFWSTILLAIGGATFVFAAGLAVRSMDGWISLSITELCWISLAVAISIGANSQQALLNGLRQIGAIGKSAVMGAAFATTLALLALFFVREYAIYLILIAAPLGSFLAGHWYVSRLPETAKHETTWNELARAFKTMARLGLAIMGGTLIVASGQLAVRVLIETEMGTVALGLFTSVWLISNYYITFLYSAIVTDLFPKLSRAQGDKVNLRILVNEQSALCLMAAAPIFLLTVTIAPLLLTVLYESAFADAALLMRMFVLGDALKVMVLPLQFALLANSHSRQHLIVVVCGTSAFIAVSAHLIERYGLVGLGFGYITMHAIEFCLSYFWCRKLLAFRYDTPLFIVSSVLWTVLVVFVVFQAWATPLGIVIGLCLSAASLAFFLYRYVLAHR